MQEDIVVKKVFLRTDGVKYVIVPKKSKIKEGDDVMLIKLDEKKVEEIIEKEMN